MGRRAITHELYLELVKAFSQYPRQWVKVAEIVGVHKQTARKAWDEGWPEYEWGRPIGRLLEIDQREARAAVIEAREKIAKERAEEYASKELQALHDAEVEAKKKAIEAQLEIEKIKLDAVKSVVEQVQAIRLARSNLSGLSAVHQRIIVALYKQAARIEREIAQDKEMSIATYLKRVTQAGRAMKTILQALREAQEAEALLTGRPTQIIEERSTGGNSEGGEMTPEQAEEILKRAASVVHSREASMGRIDVNFYEAEAETPKAIAAPVEEFEAEPEPAKDAEVIPLKRAPSHTTDDSEDQED